MASTMGANVPRSSPRSSAVACSRHSTTLLGRCDPFTWAETLLPGGEDSPLPAASLLAKETALYLTRGVWQTSTAKATRKPVFIPSSRVGTQLQSSNKGTLPTSLPFHELLTEKSLTPGGFLHTSELQELLHGRRGAQDLCRMERRPSTGVCWAFLFLCYLVFKSHLEEPSGEAQAKGEISTVTRCRGGAT